MKRHSDPPRRIHACGIRPDGPSYVAKGSWDSLGLIHKDGAEGGNCTQRPIVPFTIGIAA